MQAASGTPCLAPDALAGRVLDLAPGQRLACVGLGGDGVAEAIAGRDDHARCALQLDARPHPSAAAVLDRLLDDLASLALDRWPRWYGGEGAVHDVLAGDPCVSAPWLRAAARRAGAGHPPRLPHAARAFEFVQLLRAIDPAGLILIAEVDPASGARAAPVIEALEWCAGHGAAVVAALRTAPPEAPPYDRILYGALAIGTAPVPAAARFVAPPSKAHPASGTEKRIAAALARDPELAELFAGNQTVRVEGWGPHPRVDLVCREHRVVVELDGPEHRGAIAYANDRHRDYALLTAGYLVLRITNEQVEADLQQAIEKIRAVVRLRSRPDADRWGT